MTVLSIAILFCVLNLVVSMHVIRDHHRLGYEKVAEIGLIWVLPIMGPLVSICITLQGPHKIREYEDIQKFFISSR